MPAFRLLKHLGVTLLFCAGFAAPALAQQISQPWSFTEQNRASIAALMQQTENPSAAAAASPTLVCGGAGQPGATANSVCIILNQSSGQISLGQDSQGSQSAGTPAAPASDTDAVLSILGTK